jgi:hydrogenase maturation protease
MQSWLIFGIGNTLRRDDGAGWLLAERLAALLRSHDADVQLVCVQQLTPDLAEEIAESPATAIIFADVAVGSRAPSVAPLAAAPPVASSSHEFTPAALLFLAEKLYGRSLRAFLATVPGVDFGHGEGLSPLAAAGIDAAELIVSGFAK